MGEGSQPWRSLRRITVLAVVLAVSLTASPPPAAASTVTYTLKGTVTCPSGEKLVGIWVQSSAGGSKWATLKHRHPNKPHVVTYEAKVTTKLPTNIQLHVGCGGTPEKWESNNKTPNWKLASGTSRALNATCNAKGECTWPPTSTESKTGKGANPVGDQYKCQCTYWAAAKWKSTTGWWPNWRRPDGRIGNAKEWAQLAKDHGWRVSSHAQPRSLFVNTSGTYGHVGYVHAVRVKDGKLQIQISDQNHDGKNTCARRDKVWVTPTSSYRYVVAPPKKN